MFRDPAYRAAFTKQWRGRLGRVFHGDFRRMFVVSAPDAALAGRSFAEIAADRGQDPLPCFLDLLAEHDTALRWSTVAGMIAALWSPTGRLLLVILFTSLLPYAVTWAVGGGSEWRFTQHVYPLYLVLASSALALLGRTLYAIVRDRRTARFVHRERRGVAGAGGGGDVCAEFVGAGWAVGGHVDRPGSGRS